MSRSLRGVFSSALAVSLVLGGALSLASPAQANAADPDPAAPQVLDVTAAPYGAVGDGSVNDRPAIQAALDDAAGAGGGTVLIPAGKTFLTGGLQLGSGVTLEIDGTLLQSQNPADYAYTPVKGHRPGPLKNDLSMFKNLPFVFAGNASDVRVVGSGAIQQTRAATQEETIHAMGVGFFEATGFELSGIEVLGSSGYSVGIYASRDGLVSNTRLLPGSHIAPTPQGPTVNTDGVSIMNSQRIRVTENYIRTGDDGLYIWSSYQDPRSEGRWWEMAEPQPSQFIELDGNDIATTCCKAFTFIAWGIDAPDQRSVAISDVYVHNNRLEAKGDAVGCWCDATYPDANASPGQSPISRVTFENNEYIGRTDNTFRTAEITDLRADFPVVGLSSVKNGDFERTGLAWWTPEAPAEGDVGTANAGDPGALRDPAARAAAAALTSTFAYVQGSPAGTASLAQGLDLRSTGLPPALGLDSVTTFQLDLVTGEAPVRLFAVEACTGDVVFERALSSPTLSRQTVEVDGGRDCESIRLGIEAADGAWAIVDNVTLGADVLMIDDRDPRVAYEGNWSTGGNAGTWGGTNAVGREAGAAFEVTFTGVRAKMLGVTDYNLGLGDIYLDGELVGVADFYSPTKVTGVVVFDTGELERGEHTLRFVTSGERNPSSTNIFTAFDALYVDPGEDAGTDTGEESEEKPEEEPGNGPGKDPGGDHGDRGGDVAQPGSAAPVNEKIAATGAEAFAGLAVAAAALVIGAAALALGASRRRS